MILAKKISEERKKNGWNQEELAEKLSEKRRMVSRGSLQYQLELE